MPYSYRVETPVTISGTRRLEIARLTAQLERSIQLLSEDIALEEQRVGVFDMDDPKYPTLARSLNARKANLSTTVATLLASVAEPA